LCGGARSQITERHDRQVIGRLNAAFESANGVAKVFAELGRCASSARDLGKNLGTTVEGV
jgi:hypothetical protein